MVRLQHPRSFTRSHVPPLHLNPNPFSLSTLLPLPVVQEGGTLSTAGRAALMRAQHRFPQLGQNPGPATRKEGAGHMSQLRGRVNVRPPFPCRV